MLLHLQLLNNLAPLVSLLLQAVKIEVELSEDGLDVLKVLPHRQHVDRQVGEEELPQDLAGRRRHGPQVRRVDALALHPHLAVLEALGEQLQDIRSPEVPGQGQLRSRLTVGHQLAIQNVAEQQRVVWERAERADSFTDPVHGEQALAVGADLVDALTAQGVAQDFSFVVKQRGMFSYTGLTAPQVERMKDEFGIYAVSTGRICLAALNSKNVDYVAKAIATVIKG